MFEVIQDSFLVTLLGPTSYEHNTTRRVVRSPRQDGTAEDNICVEAVRQLPRNSALPCSGLNSHRIIDGHGVACPACAARIHAPVKTHLIVVNSVLTCAENSFIRFTSVVPGTCVDCLVLAPDNIDRTQYNIDVRHSTTT